MSADRQVGELGLSPPPGPNAAAWTGVSGCAWTGGAAEDAVAAWLLLVAGFGALGSP
jgi:hypothetical protein